MAISNTSALDIAQICYYTPALLTALIVCLRHGFSRRSGWIFIAILSVVRIVGAACALAAKPGTSDYVGLEVTAAVCGGVGLSFLISLLSCVLQRVNNNMIPPVLPPRFMKYIYLPLLVGVILSIVGGTDLDHYTNLSSIHKGETLLKAATILFLAVFFAVVALLALILTHMRNVQSHERKLVLAVLVAAPFVLVRLLYAVLQAFEPSSATFNRTDPNFWVRTFMDVVMEFVVVLVMLLAGMVTPSAPEDDVDAQQKGQGNAQYGVGQGQNSMSAV